MYTGTKLNISYILPEGYDVNKINPKTGKPFTSSDLTPYLAYFVDENNQIINPDRISDLSDRDYTVMLIEHIKANIPYLDANKSRTALNLINDMKIGELIVLARDSGMIDLHASPKALIDSVLSNSKFNEGIDASLYTEEERAAATSNPLEGDVEDKPKFALKRESKSGKSNLKPSSRSKLGKATKWIAGIVLSVLTATGVLSIIDNLYLGGRITKQLFSKNYKVNQTSQRSQEKNSSVVEVQPKEDLKTDPGVPLNPVFTPDVNSSEMDIEDAILDSARVEAARKALSFKSHFACILNIHSENLLALRGGVQHNTAELAMEAIRSFNEIAQSKEWVLPADKDVKLEFNSRGTMAAIAILNDYDEQQLAQLYNRSNYSAADLMADFNDFYDTNTVFNMRPVGGLALDMLTKDQTSKDLYNELMSARLRYQSSIANNRINSREARLARDKYMLVVKSIYNSDIDKYNLNSTDNQKLKGMALLASSIVQGDMLAFRGDLDLAAEMFTFSQDYPEYGVKKGDVFQDPVPKCDTHVYEEGDWLKGKNDKYQEAVHFKMQELNLYFDTADSFAEKFASEAYSANFKKNVSPTKAFNDYLIASGRNDLRMLRNKDINELTDEEAVAFAEDTDFIAAKKAYDHHLITYPSFEEAVLYISTLTGTAYEPYRGELVDVDYRMNGKDWHTEEDVTGYTRYDVLVANRFAQLNNNMVFYPGTNRDYRGTGRPKPTTTYREQTSHSHHEEEVKYDDLTEKEKDKIDDIKKEDPFKEENKDSQSQIDFQDELNDIPGKTEDGVPLKTALDGLIYGTITEEDIKNMDAYKNASKEQQALYDVVIAANVARANELREEVLRQKEEERRIKEEEARLKNELEEELRRRNEQNNQQTWQDQHQYENDRMQESDEYDSSTQPDHTIPGYEDDEEPAIEDESVKQPDEEERIVEPIPDNNPDVDQHLEPHVEEDEEVYVPSGVPTDSSSETVESAEPQQEETEENKTVESSNNDSVEAVEKEAPQQETEVDRNLVPSKESDEEAYVPSEPTNSASGNKTDEQKLVEAIAQSDAVASASPEVREKAIAEAIDIVVSESRSNEADPKDTEEAKADSYVKAM